MTIKHPKSITNRRTDYNPKMLHDLSRIFILALAYYITGWLGLMLAIPPGYMPHGLKF